jgi:hypothetical protein
MYFGDMLRVFVLLLFLGGLALSCGNSEPTIAYQYVVRGSGDDVNVTFLAPEQNLLTRTVGLPWTSEEFQATRLSPSRIEADGPPESTVKCVIRYRRVDGEYGGNGSGESSQWADVPNEDQTRCSVDQAAFGTP